MSEKKLTDFKDLLLEKKSPVVLAVSRANKAPHVTLVWFDCTATDLENKQLTVNTSKGRIKSKLLKKGTNVTLTFPDKENDMRYLSAEGEVSQVIEGEEALKHIHKLAHKYVGTDYPWLQPGEERLKYVIKISRVY